LDGWSGWSHRQLIAVPAGSTEGSELPDASGGGGAAGAAGGAEGVRTGVSTVTGGAAAGALGSTGCTWGAVVGGVVICPVRFDDPPARKCATAAATSPSTTTASTAIPMIRLDRDCGAGLSNASGPRRSQSLCASAMGGGSNSAHGGVALSRGSSRAGASTAVSRPTAPMTCVDVSWVEVSWVEVSQRNAGGNGLAGWEPPSAGDSFGITGHSLEVFGFPQARSC
jgi:hypothetical protein